MFVNDINPVLLKLGIFEIRYYGLVYVLGFLLVYFVLSSYRKNGKLELSENELDKYVFYLMLGIVVGARLFHVFLWDFKYYMNNLLDIFKFWEGGMAFYGGLSGAIFVTYIFFKKKKISFLRVADMVVIPAALMLALGRVANFLNGELVGIVTNVSWCVKFKFSEGCRHPVQLYEAFGRFFIFCTLLFLNNKKRKEGFLFWTFLFLMGLLRFLTDFFRDDPRFYLTLAQYFSLVILVISGYKLIKD